MEFTIGNHGPDVSFYQDDDLTPQKIDFMKMRSAGASFVFLRGGQNTWPDEDFRDYIQGAKAAGLPWGSYWFYDSRSAPESQAALWRIACGNDIPRVIAADLEELYGGPYAGEKNWIRFLNACKSQFPDSLLIIYTADWWWSSQTVTQPAYFAGFPLWVASYPADGNPADVILPKPWRDRNIQAHLWQYTDREDGLRYGVESYRIDMNHFNDFYDFEQFWGATPPPPGGNMPNETHLGNVITASLKIRTGPGTTYPETYPPQGGLRSGDQIFGEWDKNATQWFNFGRIKRANGTEETFTGWCSAVRGDQPDAPYVRVEPITPPPAGPLPIIHYQRSETFTADGYPPKTVVTEFDWHPNG